MNTKKYYILLLLILLGGHTAYSQEQVITESFGQKIYFREGYRYVDSSYKNNQVALDRIKSVIDNAQHQETLMTVDIQAWTSPNGGEKYNERLADHRTDELARWLSDNCHIAEDKIVKTSGGVGWNVLRELVAASDAAYKEGVIDIIDHTPLFVTNSRGAVVTGRKKKLMDHNYGRTWRDMEKRFFADIRCGLAVVVTTQTTPLPAEEPVVVEASQETSETLMSAFLPDTLSASSTPVGAAEPEAAAEAPARKEAPFLALKTNLLFDALLTPNVEVELPFKGGRYSLMAECWFPWYVWKNNSRAYEVLYIGAEARRWLGNRRRRDVLTGHFFGLYAGGGKYDLQWDSDGYQGEFYIAAGISYGYAHRIAKNLRLEYNIGIGFLQTDYRHYHGVENNKYLVWQNDGRYTWVGPTKVKVSLVWMLNKKKGGKR